jgi:hypothetical protein
MGRGSFLCERAAAVPECLSSRAPKPELISTNTPAATGSRTIRFPSIRCAGFAATRPASALEKKYGDFFAACLDEPLAAGLSPAESQPCRPSQILSPDRWYYYMPRRFRR